MTFGKPGTYVLEHGELWFHDGDTLPAVRALGMGITHVCHSSELLGVAYNTENGQLVKHGTDKQVTDWLTARRQKAEISGFPELVDTLVHIAFPSVPEAVEELNACLRQHERILRIQDRLGNLALPPVSPFPRFDT